jgi:hypothetical protein
MQQLISIETGMLAMPNKTAHEPVGLINEVDKDKKRPGDPREGEVPPEPDHGALSPRDTREAPTPNPDGEELKKPVNGAVGDALERRGR